MKTYKEQYDKIVEAYFKGEIKPYNAHFCFCGTLCDNTNKWFGLCELDHHDFAGYKGDDFVKMERALLRTISNHLKLNDFDMWGDEEGALCSPDEHPQYETALFNGMTAALEVLRQIHAERGDVTAIETPLVKRKLQTV